MSTSGRTGLLALARRRPKPLLFIAVATVAVIASLVGLHWTVDTNLREGSLRAAEGMALRRGTLLVEQADRAIQSVDFVLVSLVDHVARSGVTDSASYTKKMAGYDLHLLLREKMDHVPQLDAVTMINADGQLINFSRYWPIPNVNVADRDYFKALRDNPAQYTFIGQPVQNRGDGTWTIYLARRITGASGKFVGLVLGAMTVSYFEDVYRQVLTGKGTGIGLFRFDGTPLAWLPHGDGPNTAMPSPLPPANAVIRERGPDGVLRIKVVQWLHNYPLFVLTTQTEASAYSSWQGVRRLSFGALIAGSILVLAIALAVALWHLSQQRAAEAERARAVAEAELLREQERNAAAANTAKSAFLAMMSHEIRTPMHALLGLASMLLESRLEPSQRAAVAAIQDSGDTLLRILNDILDFSKLEAGKFTFENLPFSPHTLTDNILSITRPRAQTKGLAIRFEQSAGVPAAVVGDAGRIRQVLLNLLSNAVKFTEQGEVAVLLRCIEERDQWVSLEWVVRDTGIGIAADRLPSLFSDFVQADGSISRRFGGTGLGLAICKRIADQMAGNIEVESEAGKGTTFHFRLTLPLAPELPVEPKANPTALADLRKIADSFHRPLRVLIAEDNATNQMVAAKMLEEFNVRIEIASDGREAVEAAARSSFDLILMDVCMPEMDGLQATRAIRAKGGRLAAVPIIAMTANAFADDVAACCAAGMTGFVPKPTSKHVLVEAFLQALTGGPALRTGSLLYPPPADAAAETEFDAATFAALCEAIGHDSAERTLAVFLEETEARLRRLRAFAPDGEHETITVEAHTLKGAAASLGFRRLSALARTLEIAAKQPVAAEHFGVLLVALDDAFSCSLRAAADRTTATRTEAVAALAP